MIDHFNHPVYKVTYTITKNKNDFLESIKDGNLAIINGDDVSLIESNNIYFPFEEKGVDKFITHKEVINNINTTHISICRFNNGHFDYFKIDSNVLFEEGKNLNQTIVIGQISQSVSNLPLATITGFLANKCYVNDDILEK